MSTELVKAGDVAAGQITRQEFGVQQVERTAETASTAVAARETAAVQARFVMAERNPRNIERFRRAILDECERPSFAAVARYGKPVGGKNPDGSLKKVYGPSIRFIEAAIRCFRNLAPEVFTVFDSSSLRIVRVSVTDLESNICYANEIQIEKKVERKGYGGKAPEGREILGERLNSYNEKTYIVAATEDEVLVKQAALVSKSIRTQAQRLLPGDIVEEAMETVIATQEKSDAKDPAMALRRLTDAFHGLNVELTDLEMWAGKALDRLQPKQLQELREIYAAIKEGEISWDDIMAPITSGDKAEQKEILASKLSKLNKNTQTTQTVKGDTGGEPATAKAETSTQSEQKPVVEEPEKASGSPAPESKAPAHDQFAAYAEQLGVESVVNLLGIHGFEKPSDLPKDKLPEALAEALEDALQDLRKRQQDKATEQPRSDAKPVFGQRKGGR